MNSSFNGHLQKLLIACIRYVEHSSLPITTIPLAEYYNVSKLKINLSFRESTYCQSFYEICFFLKQTDISCKAVPVVSYKYVYINFFMILISAQILRKTSSQAEHFESFLQLHLWLKEPIQR